MSDEELLEELYILFGKEIENSDERYTDTIYYEVVKNKNIIKKLEKALKSHIDLKIKGHYKEYYVEIEDILNFLKELKLKEYVKYLESKVE